MITSYRESLHQMRNPSFEKIWILAQNFIPKTDKDGPQLAFESGSNASDRSEEMLKYLYSEGPIQKAKIDKVLETMPRKIFQSNVFEIIDWGCGQGLNTICFFDFLKKNGIENRVQKITLIDPSKEALERAFWHISPYLDDTDCIRSICKSVSDVKQKDIETQQPITFHFFTDVLDNPEIDLKQIAEVIGYGIHGDHYFFCVSPLHQGNKRIDAFYNYFDSPETFADDELCKSTKQEYALKIKAFKLENNNFNLKSINYYPAVQYYAAYQLDCVRNLLTSEDSAKVAALYDNLSKFETSAYYDLGACIHEEVHPILAVLNNIVTRGLPTKASPFIEDSFAKLGNNKQVDSSNNILFNTTGLNAKLLFEALHIIDPRLFLDESNYNCKQLENNAEKTYITHVAPQVLRQLLQPQRNLYSLTKQKAYHSQRVDFAFEFPYPTKDDKEVERDGCAIEIDEPLYHTTMEQKRADKQRSDDLATMNWFCERIPESAMNDSNFQYMGSEYVKTIFTLFDKTFDEDWTRVLQYALSPIAIARMQKIILEAIMTKKLSLEEKEWSVLILERDVPCAALAFADLKQMFEHLTHLSQDYSELKFPNVNLDIISTKEFVNSPLHGEIKPTLNIKSEQHKKAYDLIIDISMLRRADIENISFADFPNCKNKCYFNVRSSHYQRDARKIYTSGQITYRPITNKNTQGQYEIIPETEKDIHYFLQMLLRKEDFLPGQLPVLNRILQNLYAVGLIPSNHEKATIWQLAALLQPGITLLIEPTPDIVETESGKLPQIGIDFETSIHPAMNGIDREEREKQLESAEVLFTTISTEQFCLLSFRQRIRNLQKSGIYFANAIIDDIQSISEWSPDFQFSYLLLGKALYRYALPEKGNITLLGLTDNASFDILADIEQEISPSNSFSVDNECAVLCKNASSSDSLFKEDVFRRNFRGLDAENKLIDELIRETEITYREGKNMVQAKGCFFPLTVDNLPNERTILLPYPEMNDANKDETKQDKANPILYAKALYRMCCMGFIERITHDNTRRKYCIVLKKKPAGAYYRELKNYFLRYDTEKRSEQAVIKARNNPTDAIFRNGTQEEICKCLTALTDYVYGRIAKKQQHMADAAENGTQYDLIKDTDHGKYSDSKLLFHYLNIVRDEQMEWDDSPKNRAHALLETTRTLKRSFSGSNPSLSLINAFGLFYLGTDKKPLLEQELRKNYEEGMVGFYQATPNISDFWDLFESYNCYIRGETDYFINQKDWTDDVRSKISMIRASEVLNANLFFAKTIQNKYLEKWKL